jgi:hypothetical protein
MCDQVNIHDRNICREFGKSQFNGRLMVMRMIMIIPVTQHIIVDEGKFENPSRATMKNAQINVASKVSLGRALGYRGIFKLNSDH